MIMDSADGFQIFYPNDQDSRPSALSECLPFSTLGAILSTSRDREAATKYAGPNVIDIDEMDDEESRELLQRSLQKKQLANDDSSYNKAARIACQSSTRNNSSSRIPKRQEQHYRRVSQNL
jgi:hypothetical protein